MPGFVPGGLAPSGTAVNEAQRLEQAEAMVRDFCRWHIAPTQQDDVSIEGSDRRVQVLPTRVLHSVYDVRLNGTLLVEGTNYRVDKAGTLARIDGGLWRGYLTLTMSHGYDTPPVAVQAVIRAVAKRAPSVQSGVTQRAVGQMQMTIGGGGSATPVELYDAEKLALVPYRLEPF